VAYVCNLSFLETEIGKLMVPDKPGQKKKKNVDPILKKKKPGWEA
jgi:hypothetical protein